MKEQKLDRELRFHMEEQVRDYIAQGMSEAEARRRTRLEFGAMEQIKDECRDQRPLGWLADLWMDLQYGWRQLARSPLLAAGVVVMLTFGLGLNSSVFTFLRAELFRAHVAEPETYVTIDAAYNFNGEGRRDSGRISLDDFDAMRSATSGLAALTATGEPGPGWFGHNDAIPVMPLLVSCDYFTVHRLERPLLGRAFGPGDCSSAGDSAVVVLAEPVWRDRFDADPDIVGKAVYLNQQVFVVAGVVPRTFGGTNRGAGSVWVPYTAQRLMRQTPTRTTPWLSISGRLEPGHSRSELQAALRVVASQQDRLNPGRGTRIDVTNGSSMARRHDGRQTQIVWFIIAAALLILAGVCLNVALLLLSRADARRREVGVRLALGASRGRLLRMLMAETLLLAVAASALSAWITTWLPLWLYVFITANTPTYSMGPDWLSFAWLGAVTLLTAVLAGVAPGIESLKVDLISAMKGSATLMGGSGAKSPTRSLLMAAQTAASLVVLVLAATLVEASGRLSPIDERLDARQVTMTLPPPKNGPTGYLRELTGRLRAMPHVKSVALVDEVGQSDISYVKLPSGTDPAREPVMARHVSPEYFGTLNIPILQGRGFRPDDPPTAAVISATLAASLWPGESALGKPFIDPEKRTAEVVGVAADSVAGFFNATASQLYTPLAAGTSSAEVLVRFEGNPRPMIRAIAGLARELNPGLIATTFTMQEFHERHTQGLMALGQIVTTLGAITLFISMAGLYGVVSYTVSRRFRELGIRVAVGATRADLVRFVLASGSRPLLQGLAVGLAAAVSSSQVLVALVPIPMHAADVWVFATALGLLLLSAILAMLGPARRAALCDPVRALREE